MYSAYFILIFMAMNGLYSAWADDDQKMMVMAYHQEFFTIYLSENEKCLEESDGTKYWDLTVEKCKPCEEENKFTKEHHHFCLEYFEKKKGKSYELENRQCLENPKGAGYYDQYQNKCVQYPFTSQVDHEWLKSLTIFFIFLNQIVVALAAAAGVLYYMKLHRKQSNKENEDPVADTTTGNQAIPAEDVLDAIVTRISNLEKNFKTHSHSNQPPHLVQGN